MNFIFSVMRAAFLFSFVQNPTPRGLSWASASSWRAAEDVGHVRTVIHLFPVVGHVCNIACHEMPDNAC